MPVSILDQIMMTESFATTRYIDFDGGSDSNSGLTPAQAWKTFAKAIAVEWTPILNSATLFDQLWVIAGTSRGLDQADMDCFAQRIPAGATSRLGIRGWRASDGTRPGSAALKRPLLRADVAFTTLTQVNGTTVYKSNIVSATNGTNISQVLYKAGNNSQKDIDGAFMSHMLITGQGTTADNTIASNLVAAGANTAFYKTDTREVFVNTAGSLSLTASDWSYCGSQTVENNSKIRLQGFDLAVVEGVDTAWGERGIVIFDARKTRIYNNRALEHKVHGIICSFSNWGLQDIIIKGNEVRGAGSSTTGNTMIGVSGGSGNFDMTNVLLENNYLVRYMLQNPSGTKYTAADYPIRFYGLGTFTSSTGKLLQCLVKNSTHIDVTAAKSSTSNSWIHSLFRCEVVADANNVSTYPLIYRDCVFNLIGCALESEAGADNYNYAFDACTIYQRGDVSVAASTWGYRTVMLFDVPVSPATFQVGLFNSEWRVDIGVGVAGQACFGWGIKSDGAIGTPVHLNVRRSKIFVISAHSNIAALFDFSNQTTAAGANEGLAVNIADSVVGIINVPAGDPGANMVCFQDDPATGNLARVFNNNLYFGISPTAFSTSNGTLANWIANVDPLTQIDLGTENYNISYDPIDNPIINISKGVLKMASWKPVRTYVFNPTSTTGSTPVQIVAPTRAGDPNPKKLKALIWVKGDDVTIKFGDSAMTAASNTEAFNKLTDGNTTYPDGIVIPIELEGSQDYVSLANIAATSGVKVRITIFEGTA